MSKTKRLLNYYHENTQALLKHSSENKKEGNKWRLATVRELFIRERRHDIDYGANLVRESQLGNQALFEYYVGLSARQFELLLRLVGQSLEKTSIRTPIPEHIRLLITLRYLATGMKYNSIAFIFQIGKSTTRNILRDTTEAIWIALNKKYIPPPTMEQLREIATEFYSKSGMPNCIGAIDCKRFYFKNQFSVVLLALCDANYNFRNVYIELVLTQASKATIFESSSLGHSLLNDRLLLPDDINLPNSKIKLPYYIVGDEDFPLARNLMKPYCGEFLFEQGRKFNHCLQAAKRFIDSTFAIMVQKFPIYRRGMRLKPEVAQSLIKCTVVLHNFIRKTNNSDRKDISFGSDFDFGNWTDLEEKSELDQPSVEAQTIRNTLCNHLKDKHT